MAPRSERDRDRGELDELLGELLTGRRTRAQRAFRPAADVFRTASPPEVVVVVDLAGVDPTEIELGFAEGVLTIVGVRRRPAHEHAVYQQLELDAGPFARQVAVGADADPQRAEATVERGLLTVRFPVRRREADPVRMVIAVVRRP